MEFHEIADIFPMMTGDEYEALRDSIAEIGLKHPIVTCEGKILDGRNRYAACLELDIQPEYTDFNEDSPLVFVITENLLRRHLTPGQRACAATTALPMLKEEAKKRMAIGGRGDNVTTPSKARDEAGVMFGVSGSYVDKASDMKDNAPDLFDKVASGETTMNRAATTNKQRKKKKRVKEYTEKSKDLPSLAKEYHVIYADPPWQYSTTTNTLDATTDHHYHTLSIKELNKYLSENNINTTKNAVLFMWVTNPFVAKALEVIKAWGFEYKTNVAWVKTNLKKPGVGYYVRGRHELLFICTKGSFTPLDKNITPPIGSVLEAPVGEHSEKPDAVYGIIERLYPDCLYLELFARMKRDGWEGMGDEL